MTRHQTEQGAGTEHPRRGGAVACQVAVDEAREHGEDEHDRPEDVAHADEKIARDQRRQRVGAATASCGAVAHHAHGKSAQIISPAAHEGRSRYWVIPPIGTSTAATYAAAGGASYERTSR